MSLRFIYGRAGSGKSRFCIDNICKNMSDKRLQVLIVPEQFTHEAEKKLAHACGAVGINGTEVLSFRRMAYRVFGEVGGLTRKHMNAAGKSMLLYRVMDKLKDELKVFGRAARQPGFVSTIAETISEMKRYEIMPDRLFNAADELLGNTELSGKLIDIANIYNEFENTLHKNYIDIDDDLTILANKLEASKKFDGAEIWIDEFSGFTPQEFRVIEKLLKKAHRVNITLCTDCVSENCPVENSELFAPSRNTSWKLLNLAADNGIKADNAVHMQDDEPFRLCGSKELCHMEKNYFAYPYNIYKEKTKAISIFTASNLYSEVEDTAREIFRLCREEGLRYRDIAVVSRDLISYEKIVRVVFDEFQIPFFIDSKMDINNHPLVLLISSALEILARGWTYESVFRYLKTGLLDIDKYDIDALENYVLQWGIRGNRWIKEDAWEFRLSDRETEKLDHINEIRQGIVKPLKRLHEEIKGRQNCKDICKALFDFLCEIGVPERIESYIDNLREAGNLTLANQYSQIWNIVMEVLDQLAQVMGDEAFTIDQFEKIIASGFGEYSIGIIPPGVDQVLVGSVERSKSHEISALFIIGVNDGIFPASNMKEGILSDSDRGSLKGIGINLADDTVTKAFAEQYLIYTTLTTPSKYLRLSYPIADHEGRTMRPSSIISKLRRVFPYINASSNIARVGNEKTCSSLISSPVPTLNELLIALGSYMEGAAINPMWWDVYNWYREDISQKNRFMSALNGFTYTNAAQDLSREKISSLYGSPMRSSVSKLERYSLCPFSYFVQYGLMAKERRIFSFSPPDLGTFLHQVIDRLSNHIAMASKSWRSIDREWCTNAVDNIVDEIVDKSSGSILKSSSRYKYLTYRLKKVLTRAVWTIAEHIRAGDFEPLGYEMAFGGCDGLPPIIIELEDGEQIVLEGRIDRIDSAKDEDGTYIRIVDYKSGNKDFKLSDVYYGLQIQLITYLDAVLKHWERDKHEKIKPGGVLYFKIDDPIFKKKEKRTKEEVEAEITKMLKMKGLLLADVKLVRLMHRDLTGYSHIIPAFINKEGNLGKSSAATAEQFDLLRGHVDRLLKKLGQEILKGEISIRPCKKEKYTSCTYCKYLSICRFDNTIGANKYKLLGDIAEDELWKLMNKEGEATV